MVPGLPVAQISATAIDLCEVREPCGACQADREASVLAVGRGVGEAPLFLFRGAAEAAASEQAERAVPEVARTLALLARCPCCGERDPEMLRARRSARVWDWIFRGAPIAALLAFVEVTVLMFAFHLGFSFALLGALGAASLTVIVLLMSRRTLARDLAAADLRVEWVRARPNGEKKWRKLRHEHKKLA